MPGNYLCTVPGVVLNSKPGAGAEGLILGRGECCHQWVTEFLPQLIIFYITLSRKLDCSPFSTSCKTLSHCLNRHETLKSVLSQAERGRLLYTNVECGRTFAIH